MSFNKVAFLALVGGFVFAANADAQSRQAYYQSNQYQQAGIAQVGLFGAAPDCGCDAPTCGCDAVMPSCDAPMPSCGADPSCGCGLPMCDSPGCATMPSGGCDSVGGCDAAGGCDSAGGCGLAGKLGGGCGCLGDCDLGDQWSLFGEVNGWSAGGWLQIGYFNKANSLFNSRADEVQVSQAWAYIEKAADGSDGWGFGGRFDAMYGTDSQDTQAFGADRGWDNGFDNGPDYGFALPQAFLEAAYGDTSVKVGHFYTIIGWEVVTAPDNFFYSHAYTMYNSEPFTHTGALVTHQANEDTTIWGGYTLGWDSGFNDNGDAFLGGISRTVSDNLTLIYTASGGRFGESRFNPDFGERGYMQSIIADVSLRDDLQYIFQSDYLDTEDADGATVRETFGINQYLIKTISDCWSVGTRFEYWNAETFGAGDDSDVYAWTVGANYKPHANIIMRPELRGDWDDDEIAGLEDGDRQFTFAMDTIFLY